jgi:hypothetical protein
VKAIREEHWAHAKEVRKEAGNCRFPIADFQFEPDCFL